MNILNKGYLCTRRQFVIIKKTVNQTDSDFYFLKGQTNIYFRILMNLLEETVTNFKIITTGYGLLTMFFKLAHLIALFVHWLFFFNLMN